VTDHAGELSKEQRAEQRDGYLTALRRELLGHQVHGQVDGVAEVEQEIARVEAEIAEEAAARAKPKRKRAARRPKASRP
jgi:uncharacterized small protein (DUF1192 family)